MPWITRTTRARCCDGIGQEIAQHRFDHGRGHAMQVDFAVDAILAAAQLPEHGFAERRAPEQQRVAGFLHRLEAARAAPRLSCSTACRSARANRARGLGRGGGRLCARIELAGAARRASPAGTAPDPVHPWPLCRIRTGLLVYCARCPRHRPGFMHILVSNDDGYLAEGIRKLNSALGSLARTTIMAPDRNRSGASNSLTLDVPLRVFQSEPGVHYVTGGTPTDCVHIAISGYFDFEFDLVCSGINDGANLGDDTLYSGTVAAAIEGRFLGLPTVAFSLCMEPDSGRHFDTAARVAQSLVARLIEQPLERGMTLNVNVPDVPYARAARHPGHAPGRPAPFQAHRSGARSEGQAHVLDRAFRRRPGCGRGHGFSRHRQRLCLRHAAADRPDPPQHAAHARRLAEAAGMSTPVNHTGIGMTSARTRDRLVQRLREQGIHDLRVLERIRSLPRHIFVDEALASRAYEDTALPIGWGQTISQPYIVARMTAGAAVRRPAGARCWRWASAAATRRRCWRPLPRRSFRSSASSRWLRPTPRAPEGTGDPQREAQAWRRHEGLADAGAIRRHHRGRGAADRARGIGEAAGHRVAGWWCRWARTGSSSCCASPVARTACTGKCWGRCRSCPCWPA